MLCFLNGRVQERGKGRKLLCNVLVEKMEGNI